MSPAVSPSGKRVAVASFASNAWRGEIENLKTNIYVMNVDRKAQGGLMRGQLPLIQNGGWPTWGSDNVIFFHRGADTMLPNGTIQTAWGVFRYDITTKQTVRVTPVDIDCMTPAAISETKVAVATIHRKSSFDKAREVDQYRHIEVFDMAGRPPVPVTGNRNARPKADHYNPFVLDGGRRIGYHRCQDGTNDITVARNFHKLQSPIKDVGLYRVSGVFPTISRDGSKLAFVDNEFKSVWLADSQGLRVVYQTKGPDNIFSPVWNQNPDKDILYVCMGPSFNAGRTLEICAIPNVSSGRVQHRFQLTKGRFNNAFPSSNPDGTKFVFRSTRDGGEMKHKNLYIMEKGDVGEYHDGVATRLTNGPWTDTHCQWSPNGDWIVFSSTRDKPANKLNEKDHGLDPGYFAVYLVKASDPTVVVRVIRSGNDLAGHVNHPVFSPDGRSIAVTADLAAVSVDPISLPLFVHSVRPYGDIFVVDIDPTNIKKNKDLRAFRRVTHSRYENATPCWTLLSPDDPRAQWAAIVRRGLPAAATGCPFASGGGESFHMTGHLIIPRRCC